MEECRITFIIVTGKPTEIDLYEGLGLDERIDRMDLKETGLSETSWIDSAQDRNYWRALVNATLNLRELTVYLIKLIRIA